MISPIKNLVILKISTKIQQYEMAYRMQAMVPEITDMSKEPENTVKLYGPDCLVPGSFAANCLLARNYPKAA